MRKEAAAARNGVELIAAVSGVWQVGTHSACLDVSKPARRNISIASKKVRQLGDVRRNPPRFPAPCGRSTTKAAAVLPKGRDDQK